MSQALAEIISSPWESFVSFVAYMENGAVPYVNASIIDLTNTFLVCLLLRNVLTYRLHWARLLLVTGALSVGAWPTCIQRGAAGNVICAAV